MLKHVTSVNLQGETDIVLNVEDEWINQRRDQIGKAFTIEITNTIKNLALKSPRTAFFQTDVIAHVSD